MFHHPSRAAKTGRVVARDAVNFGLQYSLQAQATPVNERPQTKQTSADYKSAKENVQVDRPSSSSGSVGNTKYRHSITPTPENEQSLSTERPPSILQYSHSNTDTSQETRPQHATPSFRELHKVQHQMLHPTPASFSDQNALAVASHNMYTHDALGAEDDSQSVFTRQSFSAGAQTKNSKAAQVFLPGDRVVFAESPSAPGVPIVYRLPEERQANPDRLNLDRRRLTMCPILEGEDNLRLLNFQHNLVTKIQHLSNLKRLIFLDFYDNQIEDISGLSSLRSLRVLMLGKNRIRRISNLESLTKLDVLDLHGNKITRIENLGHLVELRVLNLAGNEIVSVSNVAGMKALAELNLRRNKICTVMEVDQLSNLQRLFLSFNCITSFEDISCLSQSLSINELSLDGNPFAAEVVYKQTVLKNIATIRQLDMKRISPGRQISPITPLEMEDVCCQDEERRIAAVMAKREEEKKKEVNKLAVLKNISSLPYYFSREQIQEKRRIAITNAQRQWETTHNELDSNPESSSMSICHLAELDGETLYLYGSGSLDALDRNWGTQAVSSLTTIAFKFIKYDDIVMHLHKIRTRFPSLSNMIFTETSINGLQQINALAMLRRLDCLTISEGNPVTSFTLWRPYTLFRLAHLSIRKINDIDVTAEDIVNAEKLFGTLSHITTSQLPQSRLLTLLGDSRRKPDSDKSKKTETKHERTSSSESVGRAGLQYWPADAVHSRKEEQDFRHRFSKNYVREITQTAILIDGRKKKLEKVWPTVFSELVQKAVADMSDMDTLMKTSFERIRQKK